MGQSPLISACKEGFGLSMEEGLLATSSAGLGAMMVKADSLPGFCIHLVGGAPLRRLAVLTRSDFTKEKNSRETRGEL